MLKFYVRRSTGEVFQRVERPPENSVWIHGDAVTDDELSLLARTYGMDINILRDVMDTNELPRVEAQHSGLYVFVRMVQRGKRGKIITTPLLLVVKDTVFANISSGLTLDNKLISPATMGVESLDTVGMLLDVFAAVVSEYEGLMQRTARYIQDTGQRLRTHEVTNEDFIRFVTIEDNLNEYRTNLNSMLVVAQRLRETLHEEQDIEAIEDILLYIRQLIVSIESHNLSITSIRNAYGTIANNVLNQRMKTLTVLTLLIALPNVVYGMYGMNVMLPFQDQPWAYIVILFFSLTVVLIVFRIARKRGIF
jgi:magnesium transporter